MKDDREITHRHLKRGQKIKQGSAWKMLANILGEIESEIISSVGKHNLEIINITKDVFWVLEDSESD